MMIIYKNEANKVHESISNMGIKSQIKTFERMWLQKKQLESVIFFVIPKSLHPATTLNQMRKVINNINITVPNKILFNIGGWSNLGVIRFGEKACNDAISYWDSSF